VVRALLSSTAPRKAGWARMMSIDVLWWLGVFLSLGVVAGVAWIFDA
jgi:hypothetical protein